MAQKTIVETLFPVIRLRKCNKKIEKKIIQIWNTVDEREYYSYRYKHVNICDLEKLYMNVFHLKEKHEDKGKATLFTMTIVVTIFMGFISLLYNNNFSFRSNILKIVAYCEIGFSVFYILLSAVLNLHMLSEKNSVYFLDADYYNEKNDDCRKDKIGAIIDSNDLLNIIRNNYISSSFQCVINASIFILTFIITLFINSQL